MSASLQDVVVALDTELRSADVPDYPGAMNGLQVANQGRVHRVAVAVDGSLVTVKAALTARADLLVLHHGLFWGGVQPLTGLAYEKYNAMLLGGLAVYASHLPLDMHPVHGNNACLARALGLTPTGGFARFKNIEIGLRGDAHESTADLVDRVRALVAPYGGIVRTSVPVKGRKTARWAVCSGGGASSDTLQEARELGVDTLIVGEGPHHTTVEAAEHGICVVYAGHYATETLGVQAIGKLLETRFGLPWTFLHLPTGS